MISTELLINCFKNLKKHWFDVLNVKEIGKSNLVIEKKIKLEILTLIGPSFFYLYCTVA